MPIQQINIRVRDVYGTTKYYPNDKHTQLFCDLLGQKTLTHRDIQIIKLMGYTIHTSREEVAL